MSATVPSVACPATSSLAGWMTSNVAPLLVCCSSPSMSIRSSPASTPVSSCTLVMRSALQTSAEVSRPEESAGLLDARRVPELGQELVVIVAAHDVMRDRDANCGGRLDRSVGPGQQLLQSQPHDRKDPSQLPDHDLGFDVDQAHTRVGVLVLDDEP